MLEDIASLFLVPSGVLVAALGVAGSEVLKTAVSAVGFSLSVLWIWSTVDVNSDPMTNFKCSLVILPWIFCILWLVSLMVHAGLWYRYYRCTRGSR